MVFKMKALQELEEQELQKLEGPKWWWGKREEENS